MNESVVDMLDDAETTPNVQEQKLLALLDTLVVFSREGRFPSGLNIFEAAGLERQEIRHSNFLAFLLRPRESHGLGDSFLKALLKRTLANVESSPIRPLNLALADFSDTLVSREWRNIDVLVESKSNKLVWAIENKIRASESELQLRNYELEVRESFSDYKTVLSFLSIDQDPSEQTWTPISYFDVLDALDEATFQQSANLTSEARMVLSHYGALIRRKLVPNEELIEQCRKIYALHRDALDLIMQYGAVDAFVSAAETFFKQHDDLEQTNVAPNRAVFTPPAIYKVVPRDEGGLWAGYQRTVVFWFNFYRPNNKLGLVIEIGPFTTDRFNREKLARELLTYFKSNVKNITPRYTRVYSEYKRLSDDQMSSAEAISKVMEDLYQNASTKHLSAVAEIVKKGFAIV